MPGRSRRPPYRVGVDVGGTFTDLVVADGGGRIDVFKVPSVPDDPGEGVIAALEAAARALGIPAARFLGDCGFFLHGSTVATNTLLEGKGARVGLLATRGFRDSLEARRGLRKDPWDHRTPYPPVLVPRYLRRPVGGRIDAKGREVAPLAAEDVRDACRVFRDEGVESIAVCLLNSFVNPAHEQAAAELLRAEGAPGPVSLSSEIAPVMGEYERGSTTVVNAYIMPRVATYLRALRDRLAGMGLAAEMLMLQSNGGASSLDALLGTPANLLLSGPSAGVGAMKRLASAIGEDSLINMEIGGTSCDVMLMTGGGVAVTDSLSVADYDLVTPSVDIHTVGAGGGTIARVDSGGLMRVGPEGAGARPGPAAYGLGGARPTVTDAQLVLGRLRPGPYADGSVTLDLGAAEAAIDAGVAGPLGIPRAAAAAGVVRVVEQSLLHAVERISIQRGYNPGRFMLNACGGAGPMHGASVGRSLGARAVYIPRQAGAFCAIGMQHADVRRDFVRVLARPLGPEVLADVAAGYAALEDRARAALAAEGFAAEDAILVREMDLRYEGQQWDVRVAIAPGAGADAIRAAFEAEYDRQFGHVDPGGRVDVAQLRVAGIGRLPPIEDPVVARADAPPAPESVRPVYALEAGGFLDTPVYRGAGLRFGHVIDGPAVVEEETTTIVIGPGDRAAVDALDNYVVAFDDGEAAA